MEENTAGYTTRLELLTSPQHQRKDVTPTLTTVFGLGKKVTASMTKEVV